MEVIAILILKRFAHILSTVAFVYMTIKKITRMKAQEEKNLSTVLFYGSVVTVVLTLYGEVPGLPGENGIVKAC